MTNKEAIKYLQQLYPNGGHCWLDEQRIEAIGMAVKALQKEQQFEKNRLKHCNNITNEQAELEQKFLDQHLDKHQRMPTFLDAIEYGMRLKEEQIKTKED